MRLIPFIVFCALSFALAFTLIHKGTPKDMGLASDEPLPPLAITTLDDGKKWNAEALKGRVTLINFFASWCTPCAAEMPELAALKKKFPGLHIEGVVWNDEAASMQRFLKKHGNPFTGLWLDQGGSAGIALGIRGIPESFIVDSRGIVRYRLGAPITQALREGELDALLTTLTQEAAHGK